jgi:glyceraldehyde 3-phosphate dehydrogenase
MGYVDEKLVSADMNHDPKSTSVIADQVYVTDDTLIRVMAWYDNEWGFSNRMLDTVSAMTSFR